MTCLKQLLTLSLRDDSVLLFDLLKSAINLVLSSADYEAEYGTICTTLKGEKVKSRGEKQIADYLHSNNFVYEYERPALTRGVWIFRDKISLPDFYLTDFDVYIEYWGLVNAKDYRVRNEYTRVMKWKMAQYHSNSIKFISVYPNNLSNFDWIFKAKLRDVAGVHFPGQASRPGSSSNKPAEVSVKVDSKVISHLGKYYERLAVVKGPDGKANLVPKQWLRKEEWQDINDILYANGFKWQSTGKNSCWMPKM